MQKIAITKLKINKIKRVLDDSSLYLQQYFRLIDATNLRYVVVNNIWPQFCIPSSTFPQIHLDLNQRYSDVA